MLVNPFIVIRGDEYTPVPLGASPNNSDVTVYQPSAASDKTVKLLFPSMNLINAFQAKSDEKEELGDYPDWVLADMITEGELPEPGECHPGTITKIVLDFMFASQPISN